MANDSHSARTLGRWTDADFKSTVDRDRGAGVHADMPDETRFTSGVVRLIVRWIAEAQARSETNPRDVAMFILGANPPTPAQDAEREPMLDNGLTTIVGRLWFTSPAVISGRYITLPSRTNDDRFRFIQRHLGIGSSPIIIFDPRTTTPQLRWYPQGLDQPEEVSFLNLTGSVDAIDVSQLVDDIYRQALITPSALPGGISLWEAPDRHWPKQDAEVLLQTYIKIALIAKFPYCTVRHEQSQPSGRTDIEIEQEDAANRSDFTRHAILELKVLRTYGSTGARVSETKTRQWMHDGVQQAAAYRMDKRSRWSALYCFDMREEDCGDDACFKHIRQTADLLSVALERWFMYASSAQLRQASTS